MPSVAGASPSLAEFRNGHEAERIERLLPNVCTTESDVADRATGGRVRGGEFARTMRHLLGIYRILSPNSVVPLLGCCRNSAASTIHY